MTVQMMRKKKKKKRRNQKRVQRLQISRKRLQN